MEELTKQQIILVTLLVSFVTSIATGIVTVALMDQAPPAVTQTINRVVERTIEKVVPAQNQVAAVVTKETVVVKEDDLIVRAVEKSAKSLVSIYKVLEGDEGTREIFLGNGLTVSKDGLILTDASAAAAIADGNGNIAPQSFKAVLAGGESVALTIASSDKQLGVLLLKPVPDGKIKSGLFAPAALSDATSLKLGQTVIALGGEKLSVGTGIVSGFLGESGTATSSYSGAAENRIIQTDIRGAGETPGSILLNLSGEVVGIRLGQALSEEGTFISSSALGKLI